MGMDCHCVHYWNNHDHELPPCTLFDLPWTWIANVNIIGLTMGLDCQWVHYSTYLGHGLPMCTLFDLPWALTATVYIIRHIMDMDYHCVLTWV